MEWRARYGLVEVPKDEWQSLADRIGIPVDSLVFWAVNEDMHPPRKARTNEVM